MDALLVVVVFLLLLAIIAAVVREVVREEEAGGHGILPLEVQRIVDAELTGLENASDDPAATDPELPSFEAAYATPELLQEFGIDGIIFEKNAGREYDDTRRELVGTYSRVLLLDNDGAFRTLASVNCLDAIDVAVALEDQSRDLAERLGVQFQVL